MIDRFLASEIGALLTLSIIFIIAFLGLAFAASMLMDAKCDTPVLCALSSPTEIYAIASITALITIGLYYYTRRIANRSFIRYLDVSHKISHRSIGDQYLHISVKSVLHNTSKVKIDVLNGFTIVQRIMPGLNEEDIKRMYDQVRSEKNCDFIQWPDIEKCNHSWKDDELIIEPGETRTTTCQFLRPNDVESIMVRTFFWKQGFSEGSPYLDSPFSEGYANGWGEATVYSIE